MKILIPVDFTELSDFALGIVQNLAHYVDLNVHFIHVLKAPDDHMPGEDGCVSLSKDDQEKVDAAREQILVQIHCP